jgi:hypothetical protein
VTGRYLYAITEGVGPAPGASGLRGAPLAGIEEGGLVMVTSPHVDLPSEADEEDLWSHESVVESLFDAGEGAILPMRFGTTLPDEAAVRAALRDRAPEWRAALDRVRGAIELGVRAQIDVESSPARPPAEPRGEASGPGTAYLLDRLGQGRAAAEVARSIHAPLSELARESAHVIRNHPRTMLKGAYLVEEGAVQGFEREIKRLEASLPDAAITCTGPWPPYSFSGAERA